MLLVLNIHRLLNFHINFRISLFTFLGNPVGIFIEIMQNQQMNLGKRLLVTLFFYLSIHEHENFTILDFLKDFQ